MFRLGFSLVHLGYSLVFAMVLAGFFWDQPIYESERWKVKFFIYKIPTEKLKLHCQLCRVISTSPEAIEKVLGTTPKMRAYIAAHECDPYDLLLRGIEPPPLFKASTKDYEDGHYADVYWAISDVERLFPSSIYVTVAAPHIYDGCKACRHVLPSRVEAYTASYMSDFARSVSSKVNELELP